MSNAAIQASEARKRKEELGQFLTPPPIADFMASLFEPLPSFVRLLDAGAGAGALTEAFVSQICAKKTKVRTIEATLYEIDPLIQEALSASMQKCRRRCVQKGIVFNFKIYKSDFIQEMSDRISINSVGETFSKFDVAIVNPPYRKIGVNSVERQSLRRVGIETSNLYSAFIALIQRLLSLGGQLVAITPRSFCNGPYFRSFREDFLNNLEVRRLHIFESREAAFREDSVLQENIIFHAIKGNSQPNELVISSSSGEHGDVIKESKKLFVDVVHNDDAEKFIHIPSASAHSDAKKSLEGLNSTLASLGVSVSTGRVVDFRLKDSIRSEPEYGTVPLLYPAHFNGGTVHWPKLEGRKPNAIIRNKKTQQWLVPTGMYLLIKRFTSKEENRRLVACLFDPKEVITEYVGFENHLNYFHADGQGLDRNLAVGLFAFLNSTIVDQYFRSFSGHTQVNATDLRKLAYPNCGTLRAIGVEIKKLNQSQDKIDKIVGKHIHAQQ